MEPQDGEVFVKVFAHKVCTCLEVRCLTEYQNLANFIRTHEKALANALQSRRQTSKNGQTLSSSESPTTPVTTVPSSTAKASTSSSIASVLTLGALGSSAQNSKAARMSITSHHLYYLFSKFEELGIQVGPMGIRLENIHAEASPANYVSFLTKSHQPKVRSDRDSINSVSSMRSVMSGMTSFWSGFGLRSSGSGVKSEKAKAQFETDLKYLYASFTKIPSLHLSPDHNAQLIAGYEEFPFDTAVPVLAFKNLSNLEIMDMDFRHFYGWDRLAEQLRSLTLKRAQLEDPVEVLISIVLDDIDKRRRRSSKIHSVSSLAWPTSPSVRFSDVAKMSSTPTSPAVEDKLSNSASPRQRLQFPNESDTRLHLQRPRTKSSSPTRSRSNSRPEGVQRNSRGGAPKIKRSASGSSNSSTLSSEPKRISSYSNLLAPTVLPPSKWRFLRHLNLADNSLTSLNVDSLTPLTHTLQRLDLSSNLFNEIPDAIASLSALQQLIMANCMIDSLQSLKRTSFPAITVLNLRANRLGTLAGIEQLHSLERLDIRDNKIRDPMEIARLTESTSFSAVWVSRNPFTKTHANYRITMFNIFRDTPGFTEDILIDASGPGYNEKRHLKDRAVRSPPDRAQPPPFERKSEVPQPLKPSNAAPVLYQDGPSGMQSTFGLDPRPVQHDVALGSNRSKKGPRRRIVDLAQAQKTASSPKSPVEVSPELKPAVRLSTDSSRQKNLEPSPPFVENQTAHLATQTSNDEVNSRAPTDMNNTSSKRARLLEAKLQNPNTEGEAYRQKMEALKNEVGSNWLSVLSEQDWNEPPTTKRSTPSIHRAGLGTHEQMPLRVSNQGIVSGGRTLG